MSNGLPKFSVAEEIHYLAQLAGCASCDEFQHLIITNSTLAVSVEQIMVSFTVPEDAAWIVTYAGVRSIPEPQIASLGAGDWRSSEDVNPFPPLTGSRSKARWTVNDVGQTPIAHSIGVLSAPCLFVFLGQSLVKLLVSSGGVIVGSTLELAARVNGYLVPKVIGAKLLPNTTQIITMDY